MTGFNLIRIVIVNKKKITKKLKFNSKRKVGKRHSKSILNSKKVILPKAFIAKKRPKVGKTKKPSSIKAKQFFVPRSGLKMGEKSLLTVSQRSSLPFVANFQSHLVSLLLRDHRSTLKTSLKFSKKSNSLRGLKCQTKLNMTCSGGV